MKPHDRIVSVIEELASFAEDENLPELRARVEIVKHFAERAIGERIFDSKCPRLRTIP